MEKLIYKRDDMELSFDVTDLNATDYFNKSIEIMLMLWYPKSWIESAIENYVFE